MMEINVSGSLPDFKQSTKKRKNCLQKSVQYDEFVFEAYFFKAPSHFDRGKETFISPFQYQLTQLRNNNTRYIVSKILSIQNCLTKQIKQQIKVATNKLQTN